MAETEEKVEIVETCIYGSVRNQNRLDMKEILGNKLLDYRIKKIKCQLKDNSFIAGIQIICRNTNDGSTKAIIDYQSKENNLTEQEFDLKNEGIKEMRVWINTDIVLIGFEIKTDKNRVFKFGYGNDEQLVKISDFTEEERFIVGFGVYTDGDNGVTAIYGQYISKKKYISLIYSGIFSLRLKIKNPDFKDKLEKNVDKMAEKNKILYRICQLPDNQFFNIIKYSIE